jgi:hypothetical protein
MKATLTFFTLLFVSPIADAANAVTSSGSVREIDGDSSPIHRVMPHAPDENET